MTQEKANTIKASLDNLYKSVGSKNHVKLQTLPNGLLTIMVTSSINTLGLLVDVAKIVEHNGARFFASTDGCKPYLCIYD